MPTDVRNAGALLAQHFEEITAKRDVASQECDELTAEVNRLKQALIEHRKNLDAFDEELAEKEEDKRLSVEQSDALTAEMAKLKSQIEKQHSSLGGYKMELGKFFDGTRKGCAELKPYAERDADGDAEHLQKELALMAAKMKKARQAVEAKLKFESDKAKFAAQKVELAELEKKQGLLETLIERDKKARTGMVKNITAIERRLQAILPVLAEKEAERDDLDKTIKDGEIAYQKIMESSAKLLEVMKGGKTSIERKYREK